MILRNPTGTSVAGNVVTSIKSPDGQDNLLLYGFVALTTDATVANRQLDLSVVDGAGTVVMSVHAGAVVPASQTSQDHELMQGIYRETSFVNNALQVPIPKDFHIPPGYTLKITITNGVAGDSYNYSLMFEAVQSVPGETVVS